MDIDFAYRDFFTRLAHMMPWLSVPDIERRSPSLASLIAFSEIAPDRGAAVLDFGAGVSSLLLRAIFKNVVTVEGDNSFARAVEQVCVQANVMGYDGSFLADYDGRSVDYVFFGGGDVARLAEAFSIAHRATFAAGGGERASLLAAAECAARGADLAPQVLQHGVLAVRGATHSRVQTGPLLSIDELLAPPIAPSRSRPIPMTGPKR